MEELYNGGIARGEGWFGRMGFNRLKDSCAKNRRTYKICMLRFESVGAPAIQINFCGRVKNLAINSPKNGNEYYESVRTLTIV